jgi:hypothetical protein
LQPLFVFGAFAVLANLAIAFAVRHNHSPSVVAACSADLLITLPVGYYFLVVRSGAQPPTTILPVFLSGLLRVSYLVPAGEAVKVIAAVGCETGIAWFVIRRGRTSFAARVFRSEISIFRSACALWNAKPDVPEGGRSFSMHQQSGIAMLFAVLAAMSLVEGAGVHLVARHWSPRIAWISSAFSVYGAVLLIAVARSFTLRPIVVLRDSVLIRAGLLWSVDVPSDQIVAIEPPAAPYPARSEPDYLRMSGIGDPNLLLTLRDAIPAEGLYGRRKMVRRIGISADQPQEFRQAVQTMATCLRI